MDGKSKEKKFEVPCAELEKQKEYSALAGSVLASKYPDKTPLAMVHTYGCQGNVSDGERIKGLLAEMGYGFTDDVKEADLVLYNTCAIREHAEDRIYGNVGALKNIKKANPDLVIALCGCMMQQDKVCEKIKKSYPFVNLVFGTHVIHRLPGLLVGTHMRKVLVQIFAIASDQAQCMEACLFHILLRDRLRGQCTRLVLPHLLHTLAPPVFYAQSSF